MTSQEQERLIGDIVRASFESITFQDIGDKILPLLDRLMDTSGSLFYRCDEGGKMMPLAGSICDIAEEYRDHYLPMDPLQTGLRRVNPKLQRAAMLPEWGEYIKSPVYNECTHPNQIDDFYHMILRGDKFQGPSMVGIMLARTTRQPEFAEADGLLLARVLPSLEALVQRCTRLEDRLDSMLYLESVMESNHPYAMVFNSMGKVFWSAPRASNVLNLKRKSKNDPLQHLTEAVRRLGKISKKTPSSSLPFSSVIIPQEEGPPINAELRLVRTQSEEPFIFVELDSPVLSIPLKELALKYKLSAAETEVLRLVSLGLSDREISEHLFVSMATIRTHVGRLLAKMGVRSRLQAALLVYGVPPRTVTKGPNS